MKFKSSVYGQPCLINVLFYEPYLPGRLTGAPEDCYPDEGGYGEWEVCNLNGDVDHELSKFVTQEDVCRIDQELFNFMETKQRSIEHDISGETACA